MVRPGAPIRLGTVASYDAHRGWGEVIDDADGARYGFHATVVDGGNTVVGDGARVAFLVGPGGPGRWEAVDVVELPVS